LVLNYTTDYNLLALHQQQTDENLRRKVLNLYAYNRHILR